MNFEEIRKQMPALAGLDDASIVDAIHQTYYRDLPKEDVAKRLGYEAPPPPAEKAGVFRTIGDMAIKGAQGVVDLGASGVGMANLVSGGLAGKAMDSIGYDPQRTQQAMGEYLSDAQKAADAKVQGAKGFVDTLTTALTEPRFLAGSLMQSAPGILAMGGMEAAVAKQIAERAALATAEGAAAAAGKTGAIAAKAALETTTGKAAAENAVQAAANRLIAVGAATEGAQSAGNIAQEAQHSGREYGDYAPGAVAAGLGTGLIAHGMGRAFGDAATEMFTGTKTKLGTSLPVRMAKSGAKDGVEETLQSGQEQYFTNVAQGKDNVFDQVPEQAAIGTVTGAAMGTAFGAHGSGVANKAPLPTPIPETPPLPPAPPAGPLTRATQSAGLDPHAPGAHLTQEQAAAEAERLDQEALANKPPIPLDPLAEQTLLDLANQRRDEIDRKASGTKEETVVGSDGEETVIPATKPQFLTPAEKQERDFLNEHGGDVQKLAEAYGVPATPETPATPVVDAGGAVGDGQNGQTEISQPVQPYVNQETGEVGPTAFEARKATESQILPDDKLSAAGKPFTIMLPAKKLAKELGEGWAPFKLDSGGFVVRKTAENPVIGIPTSETTGETNVSQPAPVNPVDSGTGGQPGDNAAGGDTVRGRVPDGAGRGSQSAAGEVLGNVEPDTPVRGGQPEQPASLTTWDNIKPDQDVTLYRGENAANDKGGQWWTTDKSVAERYGKVKEVTLPSALIGKHAMRGHNGAHEFVFPTEGNRPEQLAKDVQDQAPGTPVQAQAAPVEAPAPARSDASPAADGVPAEAGGNAAVEGDGVAQNAKAEESRSNPGDSANIKPGDWVVPTVGKDTRPRQVDSVGADGWVYTKSGHSFEPGQVALTTKPEPKISGGFGIYPGESNSTHQENVARWKAEGEARKAAETKATNFVGLADAKHSLADAKQEPGASAPGAHPHAARKFATEKAAKGYITRSKIGDTYAVGTRTVDGKEQFIVEPKAQQVEATVIEAKPVVPVEIPGPSGKKLKIADGHAAISKLDKKIAQLEELSACIG